MTIEKIKEFALNQIGPYYKNPESCGYSNGCLYKTSDNKMCVFGKNLLEYKEEYEGYSAKKLIEQYGQDILKPESRNILDKVQWLQLQKIHDYIAKSYYEKFELELVKSFYIDQIQHFIKVLNLFTFEELEAWTANS